MDNFKLYKGKLTIALSGELDHATAPPLRNEIDILLNKESYGQVIFDMSDLRFMDSTGVGLILGRYKLLKNKNKLLLIKSPQDAVDKVLRVSGIYSIIPRI
ncbi:MAG: anti-sigma factor antagonist [Firmicutes bacterium]|nr:anti-sigma factor antagonist [Bacillota bacterium]